MVEVAEKNIKTVIIAFHMFKKLEQRLNMLNRDVEDIKTDPYQT